VAEKNCPILAIDGAVKRFVF